jgi:hypothetical protein
MAQYSQLTHPTIYRPEDQGYISADIYFVPSPIVPRTKRTLDSRYLWSSFLVRGNTADYYDTITSSLLCGYVHYMGYAGGASGPVPWTTTSTTEGQRLVNRGQERMPHPLSPINEY